MKRIFNVIVIVGAMIIMCTNIKYAKGYSDIKYSNQRGIDNCGVESIVKIIENCNIVILTKKTEDLLQNNLLDGYAFQESEHALCYYLGIKHGLSEMYVFAVCKEALNGDFIYEKDIYVSRETGYIYRKDESALIRLKVDVSKAIQLPDVTRNVWNGEPEIFYNDEGTGFKIVYGEEGADVLDQMCFFLKQREALENFEIMYYGERTFFGRRYHEVNLIEASDTHVHILKRYYIDVLNGNVYEEPEDWYTSSRIALYFVGNIEIR